MQVENCTTITLTDRDLRLGEVNAGIEIGLPPGTSKVVIRVVREEAKELEERR